jgi:hemoglobin
MTSDNQVTASKDTLYTKIGAAFIRAALTEFYQRAFSDMIIGHFFFNKDIAQITAQQIDFATGMLGGPRNYHGKSLGAAHHSLNLRRPHFGRRQVLMYEVLTGMGLDPELRDAWLELEEQLRGIVMPSAKVPCLR